MKNEFVITATGLLVALAICVITVVVNVLTGTVYANLPIVAVATLIGIALFCALAVLASDGYYLEEGV